MLAQLICLDRRYQRMNCFNIREIQTLLKARFYADLLNETDHHLFLAKTAIGLRFKLQDINFLNSGMLLLNRYNLLSSENKRSQTFDVGFANNTTTTTNGLNRIFQHLTPQNSTLPASVKPDNLQPFTTFLGFFNPNLPFPSSLTSTALAFISSYQLVGLKFKYVVEYSLTNIFAIFNFKTPF